MVEMGMVDAAREKVDAAREKVEAARATVLRQGSCAGTGWESLNQCCRGVVWDGAQVEGTAGHKGAVGNCRGATTAWDGWRRARRGRRCQGMGVHLTRLVDTGLACSGRGSGH